MRISNKDLEQCVSKVDDKESVSAERGTLSFCYDKTGKLVDSKEDSVLVITITQDEIVKSEILVDIDGNEPFCTEKFYQDRIKRTTARLGTSPFRWRESSYVAGWRYLKFLQTGKINFYKGTQNAF